jgi:preprotein translocase subunit Sss1
MRSIITGLGLIALGILCVAIDVILRGIFDSP